MHNPRAARGHAADPGSFHKQIRSLKCLRASNNCEVRSFAAWKKKVLRWSCGKRGGDLKKSWALWPCLKPLFCMASHNCKLKIYRGRRKKKKKKKIQGTQKKISKKKKSLSCSPWSLNLGVMMTKTEVHKCFFFAGPLSVTWTTLSVTDLSFWQFPRLETIRTGWEVLSGGGGS